jgi:hypothetical protein
MRFFLKEIDGMAAIYAAPVSPTDVVNRGITKGILCQLVKLPGQTIIVFPGLHFAEAINAELYNPFEICICCPA